MEHASVLIDYGTQKTSHWDTKSYNKYNQSKKFIVDPIMQRIIASETLNGNKLMYQEAYEEECAKHQTLVICFGISICKIASYYFLLFIKFDYVILTSYCCLYVCFGYLFLRS